MESAELLEELAKEIQDRLRIGDTMAGESSTTGGGEPHTPLPNNDEYDDDKHYTTDKPKKFNGDPTYLREFLVQCRIAFRAHKKYQGSGKDELRILYACSRFTGAPSHWIEPYIVQCDDEVEASKRMFTSWKDFTEKLEKSYGDPNRQQTAEVALASMQQGERSVEQYWTEFQHHLYSADPEYKFTNGEEEAENSRQAKDASYRSYINYWKKGLSGRILDWVTAQADSESWSFNKLVYNTKAYGKRLDQANILKSVKKGSEYLRYANSNTTTKSNSGTQKKTGGYNSTTVPTTVLDAAKQKYMGPMPMEIGAVNRTIPRRGEKVPEAERERRRRERLCYRCGNGGHMARDCQGGRPYPGKVQAVKVEDHTTENSQSKEEAK